MNAAQQGTPADVTNFAYANLAPRLSLRVGDLHLDAKDHWVNNADELFSFLKYVLLYAPSNFPYRDFLTEQLNLETAFAELRRGLDFLEGRMSRSAAEDLLASSLAAYRAGDDVAGGRLLNKFDQVVFAREWRMIEGAEGPLDRTDDANP